MTSVENYDYNNDIFTPIKNESFSNKWSRKFGKITCTIISTIFMFLIGFSLIFSIFYFKGLKVGIIVAFLIISTLLLIPSIYVFYLLYQVFHDNPEYSIDGLPKWEDAF